MLSDKDCKELADMIVDTIRSLPESTSPYMRLIKTHAGASHSLIIATIKSNRKKIEEDALERLHAWLEINNIKVGIPPDDQSKI